MSVSATLDIISQAIIFYHPYVADFFGVVWTVHSSPNSTYHSSQNLVTAPLVLLVV